MLEDLRQRSGAAHHVGDADLGQDLGKSLLRLGEGRNDHVAHQPRGGLPCIDAVVDRAGGAQDFFRGDLARLARECVAAARPADSFQDAVAYESLQDRFDTMDNITDSFA